MLRSLKDMKDYKVAASDGDIGSVSDFYFDEEHWTVRYLVVETGGFWDGPSRVLISPISFREADWATNKFHLALTKDKVRNSPGLPVDAPLSRQFEQNYYQYYNWPYYWGYSGIWGDWATPGLMADKKWERSTEERILDNPKLREIQDMSGFTIQGSDEEIGHFQDFIVDDATWTIRYIVIDTRNWWSGNSVILATHWIDKIDEETGKIIVNLPREVIKNSPEWHADQPVNHDFEARLSDYYGRPVPRT